MPAVKPLRILCLHGFTQNSKLFSAKTAALRKALIKSFPASQGYDLHFSYPNGPHRLEAAEIPGFGSADLGANVSEDEPDAWAWWVKKSSEGGSGKEVKGELIYDGLETSLDVIATCIRNEGPFDGVIGFSQGAVAAVMIASLLEGAERQKAFEALSSKNTEGSMQFPQSFLRSSSEHQADNVEIFVQPPLRFVVCYSGFRAPENGRYSPFYEPKIETPVLHVLGQVDVVVEESRSQALIEACNAGADRVVVHPGGHFVPSQKPWLDAVIGFLKSCIAEEDVKKKDHAQVDDNVEDMDVPF